MTLALVPLLAHLGIWSAALLAGVVFAETGLLVGFFLPGDSLLFAAGVFSAAGAIPVPVAILIAITWLCAAVGDQVAYSIGVRVGPRLFARQTGRLSRFWSPRHVEAGHRFFLRHGHKAVILARFVPLARTFTPVVAGALTMPRRRFTVYNVVGGLLWTAGMIMAGFLLGGVPVVAAHVELFTLGLIAVSLVPASVMWLRRRRVGRHSQHGGSVDPDVAQSSDPRDVVVVEERRLTSVQ